MGLPSEQNLVSQIVEFGLNFLFLRDSNHKERFSIWTNKKQCLSDWANQVIWNSCSMFGIVAQWLDLLSDKDKIWNYILLKSGIQIKQASLVSIYFRSKTEIFYLTFTWKECNIYAEVVQPLLVVQLLRKCCILRTFHVNVRLKIFWFNIWN